MHINKHIPFQIISLAFVVILVLPILIQDGMFIDGQASACVARNLADGHGSLWFPHMSDTWWRAGSPHFMEQPPLVYAMQASFFKLFGDSIYTERLYSFFTLLIALILIIRMWKTLFPPKTEFHHFWWIPVLFWIWTPLTSWCYQNNLIENTMVIFDLLACLCLLKFLKNNKHKYVYFVLASLSVFAAFLSKGIPGIFPLVIIPLYGLIFKNKNIRFYVISTLGFILLAGFWFFLVFQWSEAKDSLGFYLNERLLTRITENPTVESRFFILKELLVNLSPVLLMVLILLLFRKRFQKIAVPKTYLKLSAFFLLIALSASFPLMLTSVQRSFYLMPSFPFFALAAAIYCLPVIHHFMQKLNTASKKIVMVIALLFLTSSLIFTWTKFGQTSRHERMLKDVHAIGKVVPENTIINAPDALYYNNWSIQMYLTRHYNISLKVPQENADKTTGWYLDRKNTSHDSLILRMKTEPYYLYRHVGE
jgi:4-amino-4-deoxy-L-arabinose transferase-like glycosyltransferase